MLAAKELHKRYKNGVHAARGITLSVERGETVGLVGESGCGKSTLARLLCCLEAPDSGAVELDGRRYTSRDKKAFFRQVQIIFQDTSGSLDPRYTVYQTLEEPLDNYERLSHREKTRRIGELLEAIALPVEKARSYPHELSGGQRQRVVIARALAVKPAYLICDEPVSSLDRETQEQILQLLVERGQRLGCLFISHDIALTARISDRICVMAHGSIVHELSAPHALLNKCSPYQT
jgi:peptide/nickel transport system ATP-binding protein